MLFKDATFCNILFGQGITSQIGWSFLLSKIDEPTSYLKLTFKVNSLVVTIFDRGIVRQGLIMLSFFIICVTMLVFSSANLALIG
jgi:hypothetical protein